MPLASDAAVAEITEVLVVEMDVIGSKDPEACYRFINTHPGEPAFPIADYISGELIKRELAASAAVIETGATNPQRIPTEAEISKLMSTVVLGLSRKYAPKDIAMISDLNASTVDRRKVCGIFSALLREIMTLPARDQIRVLRYMYAQ
jgi:hypothetical protein